jgi:hypothetical protein
MLAGRSRQIAERPSSRSVAAFRLRCAPRWLLSEQHSTHLTFAGKTWRQYRHFRFSTRRGLPWMHRSKSREVRGVDRISAAVGNARVGDAGRAQAAFAHGFQQRLFVRAEGSRGGAEAQHRALAEVGRLHGGTAVNALIRRAPSVSSPCIPSDAFSFASVAAGGRGEIMRSANVRATRRVRRCAGN